MKPGEMVTVLQWNRYDNGQDQYLHATAAGAVWHLLQLAKRALRYRPRKWERALTLRLQHQLRRELTKAQPSVKRVCRLYTNITGTTLELHPEKLRA